MYDTAFPPNKKLKPFGEYNTNVIGFAVDGHHDSPSSGQRGVVSSLRSKRGRDDPDDRARSSFDSITEDEFNSPQKVMRKVNRHLKESIRATDEVTTLEKHVRVLSARVDSGDDSDETIEALSDFRTQLDHARQEADDWDRKMGRNVPYMKRFHNITLGPCEGRVPRKIKNDRKRRKKESNKVSFADTEEVMVYEVSHAGDLGTSMTDMDVESSDDGGMFFDDDAEIGVWKDEAPTGTADVDAGEDDDLAWIRQHCIEMEVDLAYDDATGTMLPAL